MRTSRMPSRITCTSWCAGEVDLTTAQHDIAADWIGAYKKYFHTQVPLPEHDSFLKDHPWESLVGLPAHE